MLGDRYVVKKGDNLWRIAARTLGSGKQWPRIWKYNNRREVVRVTGRPISNPDRIYVGQVLLIPRLPGSPVNPNATDEAQGINLPSAAEAGSAESSSPPSMMPKRGGAPTGGVSSTTPLDEQARKVHLPAAFKYRLDTRWPPQDVGTAIIEVRMTGDVLLMSKVSMRFAISRST